MSTGTWRFFARRGATAATLVVTVVVLNFVLIHAAPGDPATFLAGDSASPEYYQQIREQYGLDDPVLTQLGRYLGSVAQGDFGYSFRYGSPVLGVIVDRIPATLLLTGTALLLASMMGVLLGVLAAWRPGSVRDHGISAASLFGYSIPIFLLAQLLLFVFALDLGWFPVQGMSSVTAGPGLLDRAGDVLHHLVLPCTSLAVYYMALIVRLTRAKIVEQLDAEYVITARAKGVRRTRIMFRHVLRNSMLPVITVIGYNFSLMFAGSVLTETVFSWPGLGRLIFDAVYARDYPLLMAAFTVIAVSVVVINLLTDVIYRLVDPRVRFA